MSPSIAVVTDSTSDIPYAVAEQQHIEVMANLMVVEGQSLEDGKGLSRREFYERLPVMKTLPTTGTASSGKYQELYDRLFEQGAEHILSIHPSGLLSGVVNAAHAAAQHYDGRVHVVDSRSISLGLGFQAMSAAEAAARGDSLEQILSALETMHQRARVIAMLDTLEYVRRSGRVSWARARIGNLLRIKPFLEVRDGAVNSLGETRTHSKGLERLKGLAYELGPLERMAVLHSNAEQDAQQLLVDLQPKLDYPPMVVNITTVIGTHVGPGCLGIAALQKV